MSEHHTDLNSYVLRLRSGEYVYRLTPPSTGYDRDSAAMWLWQPEEAEAKAIEVAKLSKWTGAVTAVRSRP